MTLPLLISLPHGGTLVPDYLTDNFLLTEQQVILDGDEFSNEIYAPLQAESRASVSTPIARAVLDMNRAEDDVRADGITKTVSCWDEPVWKTPLSSEQVERLLTEHHRHYHDQLTKFAQNREIRLGLDCHTMAAHAPPSASNTGTARPQVCLGDVNGTSCPKEWIEVLQDCFQAYFPGEVTLNRPFSGGHISRCHAKELPWVQIELSRGNFASPPDKAYRVHSALMAACKILFQS